MKSTNFAVSTIQRTLGIYVACIGLAWGMSGGSSAIGHFQHDEDVATESGQSVPVVAGNPAPDLPNVTLTTQDGRSVRVHDITGVTQAHIHTGTADGVGPVAVRIFGPVEGQDFNGLVAEGSFGADEIIDLTPEELNGLIHSDGAYLNVHTMANPPGEVRGQLVAVDDSNVVEEFFLVTASGSQQRDETVATDASCLASFRVKGENLKYKVKCFNIDGVTQVHLHLGSAQSLGAPVAFLFPIGEPTGPINGKMTRANGDKSSGSLRSGDLLNDLMGTAISDLVDFMRTDGVYLNVHTAANPPGEVRGQITVVETLAGGF